MLTGASPSNPPGMLVLRPGVAVYASELIDTDARRAFTLCGRFAAGESLLPGRLVVLLDGVLRYATAPLAGVVGVVLGHPLRCSYDVDDLVPVLREGVVTVDGTTGRDYLDPVHVLDGGLFAVTGGVVLPRASFVRGALEIAY